MKHFTIPLSPVKEVVKEEEVQELPEQQQEEEEEEELQQEEEQQGVNSIELLPSGVLFWAHFLAIFFELAKQDFGGY